VAEKDVDKQRRNNGGKVPGGVTGKGFLPGKSGNPKGRPPGPKAVSGRLKSLLGLPEFDGETYGDGKTAADKLAEVILRKALQGDHKFVKELLDRIEGKVPESIEVEEVPSAADRKARKKAEDELEAWRKGVAERQSNGSSAPPTMPTS
jgi:hypothetical protein